MELAECLCKERYENNVWAERKEVPGGTERQVSHGTLKLMRFRWSEHVASVTGKERS